MNGINLLIKYRSYYTTILTKFNVLRFTLGKHNCITIYTTLLLLYLVTIFGVGLKPFG